MIGDDSLPEGWSSAVDPAYNHLYYFNVSTGQRTWEKPVAAPMAAPAQAPARVSPVLALPFLRCMDLEVQEGWRS